MKIPMCAITQAPLKTAYLCPITGRSYEKEALFEWVKRNGTCPTDATKKITIDQLKPNVALNEFLGSMERPLFEYEKPASPDEAGSLNATPSGSRPSHTASTTSSNEDTFPLHIERPREVKFPEGATKTLKQMKAKKETLTHGSLMAFSVTKGLQVSFHVRDKQGKRSRKLGTFFYPKDFSSATQADIEGELASKKHGFVLDLRNEGVVD